MFARWKVDMFADARVSRVSLGVPGAYRCTSKCLHGTTIESTQMHFLGTTKGAQHRMLVAGLGTLMPGLQLHSSTAFGKETTQCSEGEGGTPVLPTEHAGMTVHGWLQVACHPKGNITINVIAYNTSGGGSISLTATNVFGSGELTLIELHDAMVRLVNGCACRGLIGTCVSSHDWNEDPIHGCQIGCNVEWDKACPMAVVMEDRRPSWP
jgi:hypothetical protein